jgi:3-hydroxyacyl-CoA dehydrogenase/enoyl-CoA hydratase/3-hydroxybutyryl-CoA epimerase
MPAIDRDLETLALERDADGFVRLTVTVPGHRQNVLTRRVIEELSRVLDLLHAERPRGVILLSGRPGSFFAGADVSRLEELGTLPTAEIADLCDRGKAVFAKLWASFPTAAVIDGTCLGGGLELALACDVRVATSEKHTVLGLPEVKLGMMADSGGVVKYGFRAITLVVILGMFALAVREAYQIRLYAIKVREDPQRVCALWG